MTEERTQELLKLASELVCRVRDIDPERNKTWLMSLTDQDRWDLLFVLAAMADPSAPLSVSLGWTFVLAVERFGDPAELAKERHAA